jgi:hypothetical chaperone protein
MSGAIAYGIDYGTSNSSISVALADRVELVDVGGQPPSVLRSCVYIDRSRQELGGNAAIRQYSNIATAATGCAECDRALITRDGITSDCKWVARGGGCHDARLIFGVKHFLAQASVESTHSWGRDYALADLVAIVFRRLRAAADAQHSSAVRRLVLGCPVRFPGELDAADHQRAIERLIAASQQAGFEAVEIIEEPIAAAIGVAPAEGLGISLDFGAGTFDIAVLDLRSGYVFAKRGVPIGGDDFDALLFDLVLPDLLGLRDGAAGEMALAALRSPATAYFFLGRPDWWAATKMSLANSQGLELLDRIIQGGHLASLHASVEKAKIDLSGGADAEIELERRGVSLHARISVGEFEALLAPWMERVRAEIATALKDAKAQPAEVSWVQLIGGSSQIPSFRRLIGETFPRSSVQTRGVFDAVALGLGEEARRRWAS